MTLVTYPGPWTTPPVQTVTWHDSGSLIVSNSAQGPFAQTTDVLNADGTHTTSGTSGTQSAVPVGAEVSERKFRQYDNDFPTVFAYTDIVTEFNAQERLALNLDGIIGQVGDYDYGDPPVGVVGVEWDATHLAHDGVTTLPDVYYWITSLTFSLPVSASSPTVDGITWEPGTVTARAYREATITPPLGGFPLFQTDFSAVDINWTQSLTAPAALTATFNLDADHLVLRSHRNTTADEFEHDFAVLDLDISLPTAPTADAPPDTLPSSGFTWESWAGARAGFDTATINSSGVTFTVTYQPRRYRFLYQFQPRLRQYPRDDFLGGAPRQGTANGSTSVQASARQGWKNVYR